MTLFKIKFINNNFQRTSNLDQLQHNFISTEMKLLQSLISRVSEFGRKIR